MTSASATSSTLAAGLLITLVRLVEAGVFQLIREMQLLDLSAFVVVGVAVALSVAQRAHEAGYRVAQVQRDREVAGPLDGVPGAAVGRQCGVRLWRQREIDGRLAQGQH